MWIELSANALGTEIFIALHYTKLKKTLRTPPLSFSDITAVTFEQMAENFHSTMFPPPPVPASPTNVTNQLSLPWVTFTPKEMNEAICISTPREAPGLDGLPFHYPWQVYLEATKQFKEIFAIFRTTGYHPTCW
jgi:hypothetical protein